MHGPDCPSASLPANRTVSTTYTECTTSSARGKPLPVEQAKNIRFLVKPTTEISLQLNLLIFSHGRFALKINFNFLYAFDFVSSCRLLMSLDPPNECAIRNAMLRTDDGDAPPDPSGTLKRCPPPKYLTATNTRYSTFTYSCSDGLGGAEAAGRAFLPLFKAGERRRNQEVECINAPHHGSTGDPLGKCMHIACRAYFKALADAGAFFVLPFSSRYTARSRPAFTTFPVFYWRTSTRCRRAGALLSDGP